MNANQSDPDNFEFDVFVCYYEDAADDYANKVHKTLTERGYRVFVAHIQRPTIVGNFRDHVDKVIEKCGVFLLINTVGTLARNEVIREVCQAFPGGNLNNHEFWVFRESRDIVHGTEDFKSKTGIDLTGINQPSFSSTGELVRNVIRRCENKKQFGKHEPQNITINLQPPARIKIGVKQTTSFNSVQMMDDYHQEFKNKNYDGVLNILEKILETDPINIGAWNNKGVIFGLRKKFEDALFCFDAVLTINPDLDAALSNKALTLQAMNKNQEALGPIEKALKIRPNQLEFLLIKGGILFQLGLFEESLRCYEKILLEKPTSSFALTGKAAILSRFGEQTECEILLKNAIHYDPLNTTAYYNLGVIYYQAKKFNDALKNYEESIKHFSEDPNAWNNKGSTLREMGRYEDALKDYDKAIELDPKNFRAYYNKAITLGFLERYNDALPYFDKSIDLNFNFVDAFVNKAVSYYRLEQMDNALANIRKALELKADHLYAIDIAYLILSKSGKFSELEQITKNALKIIPDNMGLVTTLGNALYEQKKYGESLEVLNKGLLKWKNDVVLRGNRNSVLIRLGQLDLALKECNQILEYDKSFGPAYYNIACVKSLQNIKNEALESLEKALSINTIFVEQALKDEDFNNIQNDADFKKLIEKYKPQI